MKNLILCPVLALALVAGACGRGEGESASPAPEPAPTGSVAPSSGAPIPGGGLSVEEALASTLEGPLQVAGYLVATGGEVRLCSALAESFPPQCAGASLLVEGLDLSAVEGLKTEGEVSWTDARVGLLGEVEEGVVTVSPTALS